jgi:hypothetical protein
MTCRMVLSALLLMCACGKAGDVAPEFTVVDSAGVLIASNSAPAWRSEDGWRIGAQPRTQIGAADGPDEQILHNVGSVVITPAGEILVAQATEIRVYNRSGQLLATHGRAGRGPGEFTRVAAALPCENGIVATDLVEPRVTLFGSKDVRTIPLEPPVPGRLNPLQLAHCNGEHILALTLGREEGEPDVRRDPITAVQFDIQSGALTPILSAPGREVFQGLQVPFGRTSVIAFSDTLVYVGDSGGAEIRTHDLGGRLVSIVRFAFQPRRVSPDDISRIRNQYLEGVPTGARAEIEPRLAAVSIPEAMPHFSDLRIGQDGTLWLRAYQPFRAEPVRNWIAVSAEGRWLGNVQMPPGFEPHAFSADGVIGVYRNDMGVEQVREYAILR